MKAVRVHKFGSPEVMQMEELDDLQPGPKQVLVRVKAAGVTPSDAYIRSGNYYMKPLLPYTPGHDLAGIVECVGDDVKSVKKGARVYAETVSGSYAEQALCEESRVYPLPHHVSFAQGAAINVSYGTAYRALFQRARALPGETVLVHGATGGVGIAALQLARSAGMNVIGTGGTAIGRELVAQQGAHHVLDHSATNCFDQILALTEGRGVDVILEMLANVNLGKDLGALAIGGRVVVIGSRGKVEINPRDAMTRDAAILGMQLANASGPERTSIHAALAAGLENRTLQPVVRMEVRLADAPRAHHAIMEPGACGKIVLIP